MIPADMQASLTATPDRRLLRCPTCMKLGRSTPLLRESGQFACDVCNVGYDCVDGVPDLLHPKAVQGVVAPSLPPQPRGRPWCLDLGCGPGPHRRRIEDEGFAWSGVDVLAFPGLTAVADAHLLPFDDAVFDKCVLQAVLQHLRRPWIALREVRRCCRTGARISGYVAFLEPEHGQSCFHMTSLGLSELLQDCGFSIESLTAASKDGISSRVLPSLLTAGSGIVGVALRPASVVGGWLIKLIQFSQVAVAAGIDLCQGKFDAARNAARMKTLRERFAVGFNFVAVANGDVSRDVRSP